MSVVPGSAKDLKEGKFVVIDGEPCKVVEIQTSAPGKHGAAKMRITAVGIFDNTKRTLLKPSDADVEIPIVERKVVQVISVSGDVAQVMDPDSYEVYELKIPDELKGQVDAGKEVEIMETMGRRMMQRVR
ncbi:MAG: translation initiation factor IF-5A [Candidatus Micrarchaeia archaeon]